MEKYTGIDSFEELASLLMENEDTFTSYENLKDFAKHHIDNDSLFMAIHILQAIEDNGAYYYSYDYSMGTLETPTAMHDMDDLRDYINSIY